MDSLIFSSLSNDHTEYLDIKNNINQTINLKNIASSLIEKITLEKKDINIKIDILNNKIKKYQSLYEKYNKNTEKTLFNIDNLIGKYDDESITKLILKKDNMLSIITLIDIKIKNYKNLDSCKKQNFENKKKILDEITNKKIENIKLIDTFDNYQEVKSKSIIDLNNLEEIENERDNSSSQISQLLSIIENNEEMASKLKEKTITIEKSILELKSFTNIKNFKNTKEQILMYKKEINDCKNKIGILERIKVIAPNKNVDDHHELESLLLKKSNLEKKICDPSFENSKIKLELSLVSKNINSLKFLLKKKNKDNKINSNIFNEENIDKINQEKDKINRYDNEILRLKTEISNNENELNDKLINLEKNKQHIQKLFLDNSNYRNKIDKLKNDLQILNKKILEQKKIVLKNKIKNKEIDGKDITLDSILDNLMKLEEKKIDIELKITIDYKKKIVDLEEIKIDMVNKINQINYNMLILDSNVSNRNINKDILEFEKRNIAKNTENKCLDILSKINDNKNQVFRLDESLNKLLNEEELLKKKIGVIDMF